MNDPVKFQRLEQQCLHCDNIEDVLKSASERYRKIRADKEVLEGECAAIVRHIKSFKDYEYFIDAIFDKRNDYVEMYSKFNMVRMYGNFVELKYEPIYARYDRNNYSYGICTIEDILNIEEIIENQKKKYDTEEQ